MRKDHQLKNPLVVSDNDELVGAVHHWPFDMFQKGKDQGAEEAIWKLSIRKNSTINNTNGLSNAITTTKYTLLTWLPISLMDQFRRVANFYFLLICILMVSPRCHRLILSREGSYLPPGLIYLLKVYRYLRHIPLHFSAGPIEYSYHTCFRAAGNIAEGRLRRFTACAIRPR